MSRQSFRHRRQAGEMVERVARALHSHAEMVVEPQYQIAWEDCLPRYHELMFSEAIVAIEAMRKPAK